MLRALMAPGRVHRVLRLTKELQNTSRLISTTPSLTHERLYEVLPPLESFSKRHIGPSEEEVAEMLEVCGVKVSYFLLTTFSLACIMLL